MELWKHADTHLLVLAAVFHRSEVFALFSLHVFPKPKVKPASDHFLEIKVKHIPKKRNVKCWDCLGILAHRCGKTARVFLSQSSWYTQLSKFKQTGITLISTISITAQVCCLEGHWVAVFPPIFPEISLPLYSIRYRWRIWSPWDFVWRRASAPSSPGIQQDYIVIISISILCDSLFHVRDLQSCFINSAWMKPHFKHRGA